MSSQMSLKKTKNHREGGHPFKTVAFPDDKQPKKSIDIAPSFWIFYSKKLKSLACPFPVGPFSSSEAADFHRRVKNCEPPDMTWPVHRVIINGRAWTYAEACDAVDKLEHNTYAFSTDQESSVKRIMEEENQKTVDEELNEAACVIPVNSREVIGEKLRGNSEDDPKNQKSSHDLSSLLPGSELLSDKAGIRGQKKPMKKRIKKKKKKSSMNPLNSSSDSLSDSVSPKVLEEESTASSPILSSSQKSFPPPDDSPTKSPLKSPSPPLSEDEQLLQQLQRENEVLKKEFQRLKTAKRNQRVASTSPPSSGSRSPKTSIPKDLPGKKSVKNSPATQESVPSSSAQKISSHRHRSNSRVLLTTPATKRPNSEIGGSSPQNEDRILKQSKTDRRSRSKDRKRLQNHHETEDESRDPANLNRSRSAEDSTPHRVHEHRRSCSLQNLQDRYNLHSAGKATPEAQKFAALEDSLVRLVTRMHHSLSNKIDRLHGAQVETGGKLDHLQEFVFKSLPAVENSINSDDDDNDVDDPEGIILPIETKEQFLMFNAKLKDDNEYRKKVKKSIRNMVPKPSKSYSTHNLSVIIRVFLTQQLLTNNFVALKKYGTKDALKDTEFYKCLRDVHQRVRGDEMDNETFNRHLRGTFNAAGDWNGARILRRAN